MHFPSRTLAAILALSTALCAQFAPRAAFSQEVAGAVLRGRVVDSTGVPRSGFLVVASRPSTGAEVSRSITNEMGEFALRLSLREVRLRVLAIGHQPTDAGLFAVSADGAAVTIRIGLRPIALPAIVATESARCAALASGSAAAVLLAEARKAILLSTSVPAGTPPRASIARFTFWTDPDGRGRRAQTVSRSAGASLRPFQAVPRAALDAEGYVVEESDGTVYRAPDASLFADDDFARDFCFSIVVSGTPNSPLVGISFEPQSRSRVVQVAGVLWVDSTSFALSHVDFRYVGLDRARATAGAGGAIRFSQLPNGLWFEERWELRMPQLQTTRSRPDVRAGQQSSTVVQNIRVTGGQVLQLQLGRDVVFLASDQSLDSLESSAAESQRIDAPDAAESDTLVSASCEVSEDSTPDEPVAELSGRVVGAPADVGVRVSAEWRERFRQEGTHQWRWTTRVAETLTTGEGRFTFCAIPRNRAITLRAVHESRRAGPTLLRVAIDDRVARVDLRLAGSQSMDGQSVIQVITPDGRPIPYATVAVDGGTAMPTQADGSIRMRTRSRAALRISARRIGFVPVDTTASAEQGPITVMMRPVAQSLDAVVVRADPTPLERAGFYDRAERVRRGAFTADFLAPEQLDARNSARASDHLLLSRYITLAWSRENRPRRVARGRAGCKMEVLVDGQRVNTERTADRQEVPIDDIVSGLEVAAIEVYPSIANAPAELIPLTGRGECGLIAIWTGGRG